MEEIPYAIIAAVTPQFLERGVLWFAENERSILTAVRKKTGAWAQSAVIIEKGMLLPPTVCARTIADLGYEKSSTAIGKGTFAYYGNTMNISPINTDDEIVIEWYGNTISGVMKRAPRAVTMPHLRTSDRPFREGEYVVHMDHGIGIFRGTAQALHHASNHSHQSGYYIIEYAAPRAGAEPDTLYVPFSQKKKLDAYIGFETPTVHRLGGSVWFRTRSKAREDVETFARELLDVYQLRRATRISPMRPDPTLEDAFEASFPYTETPDQARAIADIRADMAREQPMDRIVAGDVGFGKTEVAFRAVLRAVVNGKQTLFLTPTTVLSAEHARSARERFSGLPVYIEELSRLTPPKKARDVIARFRNGSVDMLIGTHRMLSENIYAEENNRIGLLIIDEEHRFGVSHKEHVKRLCPHVHILTLSATPIPRTLSLGLAGLRDISVLTTPPPRRKPIHTRVLPYHTPLVRDAINAELARGGQVFFLHNRIETLPLFQKRIAALAPRARIAIIHGRSPARELLATLSDFRDGRTDILVATTIIEHGVDFPNANTLIVEDATRLGLAEAHQLRGRIGRGDADSHAYFLYRPARLTESSLTRLSALEDASALGSGHTIALRDLEIRGAGNALGKAQSGTANKVGLNLYMQMLAEAVADGKHAYEKNAQPQERLDR